MTEAAFDERLAFLWPAALPKTTGVYAIVDGARDERLYRMVTESGLAHACLFRGELPPPVLAASPWLVRLERDADLVTSMLTEGFGASWGLFLHAPVDLEYLRRHLRKFLRVQLEGLGPALFRFFDPRILRVYLPTTNDTERRTLLGPILRWILEDASGEQLVDFNMTGGTLAPELARPSVDEPHAVCV